MLVHDAIGAVFLQGK